MKYIDADKLKEEVERRREFHDNAIISLCNSQTIRLIHSAGLKEDEEILSLIDSLEQEQEVSFEDIEFLLDKVHFMSGYWIKTNPDCTKIIKDFNERLNAKKV